MNNKGSVAILCGGGPAPGINTVIGTIAKVFLNDGKRVIGIHGGFEGIFEGTPNTIDFDFKLADSIFKQGGSALRMSRYKPKDNNVNEDFFVKNNVKLLVTIGGDDTASTANRISEYLSEKNINISNIHVPKTIDNDLPLPEGSPTFGYQSAKNQGVNIAQTVYEDARTSGNWFIVSAMGREAGHLAFGIGAACHYPMIIIPEMFNKTDISFTKIINLVISAIIKRKLLGIPYGVAIISEGVFHFMSDEEIKSTDINFTYDEHGHPELGNVSKAHIFNVLLQRKLKDLKIKLKSRPVELGYEMRCVSPIAFDLMYCALLGYGVKKLYDQGVTGAMVTSAPNGDISPLYLKNLTDNKGKIKPRLVSMNSQKAKMVFEDGLQYITDEDYTAVKEFFNIDPKEFDFRKILKW